MSSVRPIPETGAMSRDELSADDAWRTVRSYGARRLLVDSFVRFRFGDGFSHARAFGLQLSLAAVPLVIAGAGLATLLGADAFAEVVARTVVAISPGSSESLLQEVLDGGSALGTAGAAAVLAAGLLTALVAGTTAFGQIERGANRIYGVQRDRSAPGKYGRAATLALTAGTLMATGLLLIVAGGPFGEAMTRAYGWSEHSVAYWNLLRWPLGLVALVLAVTALFRYSPSRRQPGLSWLAVGGVLTVLTWLAVSGLLAVYVITARGLDDTYGPLTAVMVLLIWANVTGIALLGGISVAAQLEAVRVGQPDPTCADVDVDGVADHTDVAVSGVA